MILLVIIIGVMGSLISGSMVASIKDRNLPTWFYEYPIMVALVTLLLILALVLGR